MKQLRVTVTDNGVDMFCELKKLDQYVDANGEPSVGINMSISEAQDFLYELEEAIGEYKNSI